MREYDVKVSATFMVEAKNKDEAIEAAADYVRDMKVADWDYELTLRKTIGYKTNEGNFICVDCTGGLPTEAVKNMGYTELTAKTGQQCNICGKDM